MSKPPGKVQAALAALERLDDLAAELLEASRAPRRAEIEPALPRARRRVPATDA